MATVLNMLTGVDTREVSLVRRGANNKRFMLSKSKEKDMELNELIEQVLKTAAEGEEGLRERLKEKGASQEEIDLAIANYRMQNGFKDKVSKATMAEVSKAAGMVEEPEVPSAPNPGEAPAAPPVEEENPHDEQPTEETPVEMPADAPEEVKKAWDAQKDAITKMQERIAKAEEFEREVVRKEYVAKCAAEYSHLPGMNSEDMGAMLQKAYGVSKEFGEQLEKTWKGAATVVEQAEVLKSVGKPVGPEVGTAEDKIEQLAKKASEDSDVSIQKARAGVYEENPELYEQYLEEKKSKQVG